MNQWIIKQSEEATRVALMTVNEICKDIEDNELDDDQADKLKDCMAIIRMAQKCTHHAREDERMHMAVKCATPGMEHMHNPSASTRV